MRLLRLAVLAIALIGACAVPAHADGFITPFLGFNFGGDSANCVSLTQCNEKRLNWGAAFGATSGVLGIEEDIGYAPSFFGKTATGDNAVLTVMTDLMAVVPAGPIRPYGLIGLGLIRPHAQFDAQSLSLDKNALGWDIGGGLDVYPSRHVGLRADLRHIRTFKDVTLGVFSTDQLGFWRASFGLAFRY